MSRNERPLNYRHRPIGQDRASVIVFRAPARAKPKAVLTIDLTKLSITITITISLSTSTLFRSNNAMNQPTPDAPIPELEVHRKLIYMIAESQIQASYRSKIDADDLVQETFQAAYASFASVLEPDNPAVVKKWLKTILCNVLTDHIRQFKSQKRDIHLEQSVARDVEQSSAGVEGWIASGHTSPSMAAARNEELARLADGIRALPDDMREVVVQKHINNKSIQEIAEATNRSTASVAGLLRRGLAKLRASLG
jgi:RNA polymerase sigma-70 factor, ECF subfamily